MESSADQDLDEGNRMFHWLQVISFPMSVKVLPLVGYSL